MSIKISESANIGKIKLTNQGSDPSAPASGFHLLYVKSGGLYLINSAGTIAGPLIDGASIVSFSADISPAQITANQNNYNPAGLSTANTLRLTSDAARNITGLAGGADGRLIFIHNVGAQDIVLKDEDTSSTAANRFALTADFTLTADAVCLLQYDSTSSRWRLIGGGASTDAYALHVNVASEIQGLNDKSPTLSGDDLAVIEDATDSYNKKKVALSLLGVLASVALYNQAADIAATDISADSYYGLYRVSYYVVVSLPDAAAGAVTLTVTANNGQAATSQSSAALSLAAEGFVSGEFVVLALDANAPQYATTHTGSYGTATYDLFLHISPLPVAF